MAITAGVWSEPLRCYQIVDCDWFEATSTEQTLELMREIVGDEDWDERDNEITLSSDELVDKRWLEEDERDKVQAHCVSGWQKPKSRVGSTAASHWK